MDIQIIALEVLAGLNAVVSGVLIYQIRQFKKSVADRVAELKSKDVTLGGLIDSTKSQVNEHQEWIERTKPLNQAHVHDGRPSNIWGARNGVSN